MNDVPVDWLQRARLTAAEPSVWLQKGRVLRQSSEDLWNAGNEHDKSPGTLLGSELVASFSTPGSTPPETGGMTREVSFMLFGFALENLAKGIIVCQNPRNVTSKSWNIKKHKLVELMTMAKVVINADEEKLLERITRLIVWKGRYPVPLNFNDLNAHDPLLGYIAIGETWPPDEYTKLSAFYEKLKMALIKAMEATEALPADYDFSNQD